MSNPMRGFASILMPLGLAAAVIGAARAETSAHTRSRSACSSRHPARETRIRTRRSRQARLDPLADRHPPILPAAFRKLDA